MKLHKPLLDAILNALHKIIHENFYSDKVLEHLFKSNKKLGKRDRQIIAETTYNIIRYYYYFQHITNSNDHEKILNAYLQNPNIDLNIPADKRITLSFNNDLWTIAEQQLGKEKWLREAEALNQSAPLVIRTNTLKTSKHQLQSRLKEIGIETIENQDVPEALIITNKKFLTQNEWFQSGHYEFQDLSSQKVAHFIPYDILQSAHRIIDACAGAGGKTLHLSALKNNKGQIIAMDIDQKKLQELKKRCRRAGCTNVQTKLIDSSKTIKRLENSADILLIDAPCTGTGVIKRKPDTKLKFTISNMNELLKLQQNILSSYSKMLKTNGYLLYVTCSILPAENEQQVQTFLNNNPNYQLIKQTTLYPSNGFDGFYMALLKKQ
ncbi:MAG: RsmB/NOP family class I SAM-dependent RNA methyltransferase [Bacteroidetes bacterium]|jgi:16S rRNA (cytosine967-C5)-methyltransferase|nr:MAG: RsmB/NOP family class I SAM-dependent RNA methyltransferase [Bacteroidota bacterium]